jgi:hypothetical protein
MVRGGVPSVGGSRNPSGVRKRIRVLDGEAAINAASPSSKHRILTG